MRKVSSAKSMSHTAVQVPPPKYMVRGPNIGGYHSFDRVSIFANHVETTLAELKVLRKQAKDYPMPAIKHYVFKMTESSVIRGKSKMEFVQSFTSLYLNKYLQPEFESNPIEVVINCNRNKEHIYIRMVKGKKGGAMITSGWKHVVDEFDLKKEEICIFSFRNQIGTRFQDTNARLMLVIVPLDK